MKYLILLLSLLSFTALHAQNGWKDMGGYKETSDSVGKPNQIICTPDGKYLYTLTATYVLKKWNYTIHKFDIDSGRMVFAHDLNLALYLQIDRINLNSDATTYTLIVTLPSKPNVKTFIVKYIDTDQEAVSCTTNQPTTAAQIDFDSVLRSFIVTYNGFLLFGGMTPGKFSNGSLQLNTISGDTIIDKVIFSTNTERYAHKFGEKTIACITNDIKNYGSTNTNINFVNYMPASTGKGITLAQYNINSTPSNLLALSPSGKQVAASASNSTEITTWYIDSTRVNQLNTFHLSANTMVYTTDNQYILLNSPSDSSIYTISNGLRTICGVLKTPLVRRIIQIIPLPHSNSVLAVCSDGRYRLIDALVDTLTQTYSFIADKFRIYQRDAVAFFPLIPALENSAIAWSFGDGKSSAQVNPLHVFADPGLYDITMKVTDSAGEHTTVLQKFIEVLPLNLIVDFEADRSYGPAPHTVRFKNTSSGSILSYKWNFGDGDTSAEMNPMHTFTDQRLYSISLTVNDGVKDTMITKLHYINADVYPSFCLKTKRTYFAQGRNDHPTPNQNFSTSYVFENMLRNSSGKAFLKIKKYDENDVSHPISGTHIYCGVSTDIYTFKEDGSLLDHIGGSMGIQNEFPNHPCIYNDGTMGLLNKNLVSYFMFNYYISWTTPIGSIVNGNVGQQGANYPYISFYYTVRPIPNGIDCFSFRKNNSIEYATTLCFYRDTTKLIAIDSINGYALPAIETSSEDMIALVSMQKKHIQGTALQLRRYNKDCSFIDSTLITGNSIDFIYDILRMPNKKYLLCGVTPLTDTVNKNRAGGVYMIMDESGTIEYRRELPQWYSLKSITKMDDRTFAITGEPTLAFPGFVTVKSDGRIAGDFRADISSGTKPGGFYVSVNPNSVNVCYGKTMRTVLFTRNDGYNAELYVSDNPYLKDISVSVDESPVTGRIPENQLTVSPNPTDGNSTLHYYSTSQQRITLTVTSLLGEVYRTQMLDVESGENTIPLVMSGFGSGVAFVTVAGERDVHHVQVCVVQ